MSTSNITIETLAEKLGQTVWTKGDLKRIYLNDAGFNTKKMSTKTFIFQTEDGEFKVSCRIECPSQPYQWIQSQEEEVKEGIYNDIERALATEVFLVVNENDQYIDDCGNIVALNDIYSDYYFSQKKANNIVEEYGLVKNEMVNLKVITMPVSEFKAEVEKLDKAYRAERDAKQQAAALITEPVVVNTIPAKKPTLTITNTEIPEFGVGSKVKHARFGEGTVIAESNENIEVDFINGGNKQLLKKFAKLERV
jgi:hypothetical protein